MKQRQGARNGNLYGYIIEKWEIYRVEGEDNSIKYWMHWHGMWNADCGHPYKTLCARPSLL